MLAAIEAGIITPSTKTRLMELEADRTDIEKGIAHELLAEPEFERDQIIYFLERFRSGDINDEAYRIMLVDTFLNSVYLYDDDHLVLVMNYSGENCKVDLKLVEGAVSGDGCKGSAFAPSSARKLREVHSGVWAADASLLAGRRITIRIYTAIAVGQAFRRNACMHFDSKAENILFYECFSAFFFLKTAKIPFVLTKILTNFHFLRFSYKSI